MRIVWSETAIANLVEIRKFILDSVERLAEHPHLGHPGREPETRELIVAGTPYIIPYRIYRSRLCILAVLHAAQSRPEE
jgi:toxin ParE1/3/4